MTRGKNNILFLGSFLLSLMLPIASLASTRTVYVDGFSSASTVNGFTAAATAKCIILLNNPSTSKDQTVTLKLYVYTLGTPAVAGNATSVTPSTGWVNPVGTAGVNPFVLSNASIPVGTSAKYEFAFPSYPIGPNGQQVLFCRGTIEATDTASSSPGFLVASGMFLTFSEASAMQTAGVTSATTNFQGNAVYSQMPITINRGRPF